MFTEDDLAVAKGLIENPTRLKEILKLKNPEIVLDLLHNPLLDSTQRVLAITLLLSKETKHILLPDKIEMAISAYKEYRYVPADLKKVSALLKTIQEYQIKLTVQKLTSFLRNLEGTDLMDLKYFSEVKSEISDIKDSSVISLGHIKYSYQLSFWSLLTAARYATKYDRRSNEYEEVNKKIDLSLVSTIRFADNFKVEREFGLGNQSHPAVYANQLIARAQMGSNSYEYKSVLEKVRDNVRNYESLITKARAVNKKRAEINQRKAIELRAVILEQERQEQERKRQKEEQLADKLMAHRAEGYANAEYEFSEYLTNLSRAEKRKISFDTLGNFLASNYTYKDLSIGFHTFINHCFNSIDHPVITFFAKECEFIFETSEGDFYTYRLVQRGYQAYIITEEGPYSYDENGKRIGVYARKEITYYPYTDSWGLKKFFDEHWMKKGKKLKNAEFKRPGFDFDFLDLVAYLYSDPTIIETIPLYFSNWKFFADGLECEGCGRPLTHPISAVKGKGPVCGEHQYKLAMSDGERVEKYIRKYSKMRLLSRDSPLVKHRISRFSYQAPTREQLLKLVTSRRDLTSAEARSHIQSYISNRY